MLESNYKNKSALANTKERLTQLKIYIKDMDLKVFTREYNLPF